MKKTRVIILFGGRSAEHEISLLSARNVLTALDRARFEPVLIGIDKAGRWHRESERTLEAAAGDPAARDAGRRGARRRHGGRAGAGSGRRRRQHAVGSDDVVFPVLHGTYGEDGTVQGLLELAGVAYVGAGVLGSAVGMDKDVAKRLLRDAGIPIVDFALVTAAAMRRRSRRRARRAARSRLPAVRQTGQRRLVGRRVARRAPRRSRSRRPRRARVRSQGADRTRGRRARDRVRGAGQRRSAGVDPRRDHRAPRGRLLFVRREVRRSGRRELEDPGGPARRRRRRACRRWRSRRSARSSSRAWRASTSS